MRVPKKRRGESRTDYAKRLKLLKSGKPRIVFRKSNRFLTGQYVISSEAQDKVFITVSSKELLKNGWDETKINSLKTLPASYLTGMLLAKKIKEKKLDKKVIIDFGMIRNLHKTKGYAFLKGLIDAGMDISYSEKKDLFPSEERLLGKHLKQDVSKNVQEIKSKLLSK